MLAIKQRAMYWAIIVALILWVAVEREQTERYRYADAYLRADNDNLRARVLGLDGHYAALSKKSVKAE